MPLSFENNDGYHFFSVNFWLYGIAFALKAAAGGNRWYASLLYD